MAWTTPRTWVSGEIVTAALGNAHWRDNLRYLKGLDGVPTIESGLTIDNTDGDERLLLPLLTTAECSTVLNAEGEVAFDSQTHDLKYYNGSAIISAKDAATLSIASQAQGDILYASSATAFARLGPGTSGQFLKTQGAAANPVWASALAAVGIFIPFLVGLNTTTIYPEYHSETVGFGLNAAGEVAKATFTVPHNFTTLSEAKIKMVISGGTAGHTMDWTVNTHWGAVGEENDNDTDQVTENGKAIGWGGPPWLKVYEVDITAAFTGIVADDHVYVEFIVDALSGASYPIVSGIQFLYT